MSIHSSQGSPPSLCSRGSGQASPVSSTWSVLQVSPPRPWPVAYTWNRRALFSPWSSPRLVVPSPHPLGFLLTSLATAISFPWLGSPPVLLRCPGPHPWASSPRSMRSHPWSSYRRHGCKCDLVSGQVPLFISPARPLSCTKEHPMDVLRS